MILLSYLYRFASNFVFLALVYFSLNFLERYPHRAIVAILVLVYSTMYAVSALRLTCHQTFIQRRLEPRFFVRHVAGVEQRAIGGAGRGCAAERPLR